MKGYYGFLSDLDGTVMSKGRVVTSEVVNSLKQLKDAGIAFGFCTGHVPEYFSTLVNNLGQSGMHICCGGSRIVDGTGKTLWQQCIPNQSVIELATFVENCNGCISIKCAEAEYLNDNARKRLDSMQGYTTWKKLEEFDGGDVFSMYTAGLDNNAWQFLEEQESITLIKQKSKLMDDYFADITPSGITKRSGVLKWCEIATIEPTEVVGIGDAENDIPFLSTVGLKVAMGNAVSELLDMADIVAPSLSENGVAWTIRKFFINSQ